MSELLTPDEARVLREARIILVKVGIRTQAEAIGSHDSLYAWNVGKLDEAADIAESAVFNVLTTAFHHCDVLAAKAAMDNVYEVARQ